jgi:CBS domain-containing protein/uncharacterized protein (DUF2267 family)
MSLRWYCRPRLLVLGADRKVIEAARAIEQNEVGAVVVQEKRQVVGIVTDRDLVVRVLARGLDPATTRLGTVMSTPVALLSPSDSPADAVRLMRERNVRRIPLVEAGRVVGMVTLDDLLLDEAAALDDLALIVQTQIGQGGPAESKRTPARKRSSARAAATLGRMVGQLRARTHFKDRNEAEAALRLVLASLMRRLTAEEGKHLLAQLPSLLQPALRKLAPGPDKSIRRATIEAQLVQELEMDADRAASVLAAVGATVAERVSSGQMEDVRRQLPRDLRDVFSPASTLKAARAGALTGYEGGWRIPRTPRR